MLFSGIIFGPIQSRRLGISLGINLLGEGKVCSFDCIYCECGYNSDGRKQMPLPSRKEVYEALETRLKEMRLNNQFPDVLTFAGNGEPTLHPDFEQIIDDTIELRNKYFPNAKISVLSNSTMIEKESVFRALNKIDNNILKLDSVFEEKIKLIDAPVNSSFSIDKLIENLKRFNGNLIIQTMFLSGTYQGVSVDNTSGPEINAWIDVLKKINPKQVMIYTIDRITPAEGLKKIPLEKLNKIAEILNNEGFNVSVSG